MPKTTIFTWTSARTAILESRQHGWTPIKIDTSTLTQEERELLAECVYEQDGARFGGLECYSRQPEEIKKNTQEGLIERLRELMDRVHQDAEVCRRIHEEIAKLFEGAPILNLAVQQTPKSMPVPKCTSDVIHLLPQHQKEYKKLSDFTKWRQNKPLPTILGREEEFDELRASRGYEPMFRED